MRKVAKLLTDYVIKKSMVDEADQESANMICHNSKVYFLQKLFSFLKYRYGLRRDIFLCDFLTIAFLCRWFAFGKFRYTLFCHVKHILLLCL